VEAAIMPEVYFFAVVDWQPREKKKVEESKGSSRSWFWAGGADAEKSDLIE